MKPEERIAELETAIRRAWRLLGGSGSTISVLALLPGGGVECERLAEIARDTLGAAMGEPAGSPAMRTATNQPWPPDNLDDVAEQVMAGDL